VACRCSIRVRCGGCRGKTSWMAFNAMYLWEQIVWRSTSWLIDKFPSRPHTAVGNKWIRSTWVALRLHLPAAAQLQLRNPFDLTSRQPTKARAALALDFLSPN
jgi:hypothetical protein